jgi:hypothetical protein
MDDVGNFVEKNYLIENETIGLSKRRRNKVLPEQLQSSPFQLHQSWQS